MRASDVVASRKTNTDLLQFLLTYHMLSTNNPDASASKVFVFYMLKKFNAKKVSKASVVGSRDFFNMGFLCVL